MLLNDQDQFPHRQRVVGRTVTNRRTVPLDWKGLGAVGLWEAGVYRDDRGLVRVPYRLPGGALHNEKVFGDGRSWWATTGLPLVPFGLECMAEPAGRERRLVWLAEGESDALCLREHCASWRDRRVDVLGLPGASTWRMAWARYVQGYEGAYVFPDRDPAGERMARAVAASVSWGIVVWLAPGDDVRGLVQRDGPDALDAHILAAEREALLLAAMRFNDTLEGTRRWLRAVTW